MRVGREVIRINPMIGETRRFQMYVNVHGRRRIHISIVCGPDRAESLPPCRVRPHRAVQSCLAWAIDRLVVIARRVGLIEKNLHVRHRLALLVIDRATHHQPYARFRPPHNFNPGRPLWREQAAVCQTKRQGRQ